MKKEVISSHEKDFKVAIITITHPSLIINNEASSFCGFFGGNSKEKRHDSVKYFFHTFMVLDHNSDGELSMWQISGKDSSIVKKESVFGSFIGYHN